MTSPFGPCRHVLHAKSNHFYGHTIHTKINVSLDVECWLFPTRATLRTFSATNDLSPLLTQSVRVIRYLITRLWVHLILYFQAFRVFRAKGYKELSSLVGFNASDSNYDFYFSFWHLIITPPKYTIKSYNYINEITVMLWKLGPIFSQIWIDTGLLLGYCFDPLLSDIAIIFFLFIGLS